MDRLISAAGIAALIAALGAAAWAMIERSGRLEALAANTVLTAQVAVLARDLRGQTAAIESVRQAGDQALERSASLMERARVQNQPLLRTAAASDAALVVPPPSAADCRDAWVEIARRKP